MVTVLSVSSTTLIMKRQIIAKLHVKLNLTSFKYDVTNPEKSKSLICNTNANM